MSWYKTIKKADNQKLNRELKSIIRDDPFFVKMFAEFNVPLERIDNHLSFEAKELNGRYAQGNGKIIYINQKLVDNDFCREKLHLIVHEIAHWLTRQREKEFYFTDPEEIDAFMYGMAYEIIKGKDAKEIEEIFYPIISAHFDNKANAKKAYDAFLRGAAEKAEKYKQ